MNPIEDNAIKLLSLMIESGNKQFQNEWLRDKSGLSPKDINIAVDYLGDIGAIEIHRAFGDAPFNFGIVVLKSRGNYIYHEYKSVESETQLDKKQDATMLLSRPVNPIGSPYGFTEQDWIEVALRKRDISSLYVVVGMALQSKNYDKELLLNNIQSLLQETIDQYNIKFEGSNIRLQFKQLSAGFGEHLFNTITRDIIGADIAFFETSDLNPNVMIELGVALTWGTRVVPIRVKSAPKPPSDISGQTWIEYENSGADILDTQFKSKLFIMVERVLATKRS